MIDIIVVGKRSLYNPALYQIKELYKNENWLLIDLMFTWDLPKAVDELKQQRLTQYDKIFIDGVGWRNLGNTSPLDWDAISHTIYEQDEDYQVTKITSGCPQNCSFCFSDGFKVEDVPTFNRNKVMLVDENILAHPNILDVLDDLRKKRVDNKVIYYEAVCGFDKHLLNFEIASALKKARFITPRIAWDNTYDDNAAIDAISLLKNAGYNPRDISVFVITNYKTPYDDCLKKLESLKACGVKINDCSYNCCHDSPIPHYWNIDEMKDFRRKARKHNQLIAFKGYDPEPNIKV